jgi:hypothetical protein
MNKPHGEATGRAQCMMTAGNSVSSPPQNPFFWNTGPWFPRLFGLNAVTKNKKGGLYGRKEKG